MAQLVLGAAGAAVGSLFGVPQLGWMIGVGLGSAFAPKQKFEAPQIADTRFARVDLGQSITWVAGSPQVAGNVIYTSIKRPIAHTEEAGGKNGGGAESSYWTYEIDVYIKLTENQIAGVSRAWKNGELVHGNGVTRSGIWAEMRVYTGGEGQLPDPDFEAAVGAEKAQAHLGCGAVFIKSLQLDSGGNVPVLKFEVGNAFITIDERVKYLLVPSGGSIVDESMFGHTVTTTGTVTPDVYELIQFPPVAAYGGDTNYVTLTPDYTPASGASDEFTFEYSFILGDSGGNRTVWKLCTTQSPTFYLQFAMDNVGAFVLQSQDFSNTIAYLFGASQPFHNGTSAQFHNVLHHLILQRKNGVTRMFIKNMVTGTLFTLNLGVANDFSALTWPYEPIHIGRYQAHTDDVPKNDTYIGNVRLSYYAVYDESNPNVVLPLTATLGTEFVDGEQIVADLGVCVSELMLRAGYAAAQFDVTALASITKPVRGLAIGRLTNTRSVLELLAQTHWFTWQKRGFQIVFLPRVEDVAASIPFDDLGVSTSATSDRTPLEFQFASELELPAQVSVTYPNVLNDYQPDTQLSDHFLSQQQSVENIELAVGMTPTEAKAVADAIQIERLAAMGKTTVTVPLKWLKIEPNDVVNLYDQDGREYRVRVGDVRDHGLYLEWDVVLDDVRATLSAGITDGGNTGQSTVQQMALTEWLPLDMPLIRDADNNPGWWVAAAPGVGDLWPGAAVLGSWDGVSFSKLADTTDAAVFGETTTVLGDWTGGNVFDTTNSVTVSINGEASSYTRAAMLSDLSLGVWFIGSEVIRARTATLVSAGVYRLSNLIRGFRGTEWAMGTHVVGERAVLINSALRRVATQQSHIGLERQIKAITAGLAQTTATAEAFTDTGIALKPFAPVNLKGAWDVGTGDLALTWRRRTRLSHRFLAPGIEPPLGEASELYDVEIWDTGFTTLKHTFSSVTTPSQTYTAAQQTTDFGAPQSSVGVRVYQRSEAVSRGYKLQGVV